MKTNLFTLENKTVLVTGASSGIGRQCAITCSRMGARVLLFGRNKTRLDETLHLMELRNNHRIFSIDLNEFEHIKGILKEIVSQSGKIDGLINCAGISTTLPFHAVSSQKMEHYFKTNVISSMNLTNLAIRSANFSANGGSVVFISSVMGVAGENGKVLYSMTKGALIASVKSLAIELAKRKIRVNAILPGVVDTPMSKNAIYNRSEESLKKIERLHPLGLGKPVDVANAALFLLSDASSWITGTNMIVDGGYLAR